MATVNLKGARRLYEDVARFKLTGAPPQWSAVLGQCNPYQRGDAVRARKPLAGGFTGKEIKTKTQSSFF